jgi:hypothetical protein
VLNACDTCAAWVPGGAPGCPACAAWIEDDLAAVWRAAMAEHAEAEPSDLAEAVVASPTGVPWRLYDAALATLTCRDCAAPLGSGSAECVPCEQAHGRRWAAAEPDRPDVPFGNEHAIRVSTTVARIPQRFPAHMVPRYAGALPLLIAGQMPAKGQPAAIQRYLSAGGDATRLFKARSWDEAYDIAIK